MSAVITVEQCLIALQAESAWRKKEILSLRSLISSQSEADNAVLRRSAVVMIYAHWEGFVKRACELYISHINERISRFSVALSDHFHMAIMWDQFRKSGDHLFLRNPSPFIQSTKNYFSGRSKKDLIPSDPLDTESNLNSKVLKKLAIYIDVDYTLFETKEKLIDENLLKQRNRIAHGERIPISTRDYDTIDTEIRYLIDLFQKAIEDCVQGEKYKSPSAKYLKL